MATIAVMAMTIKVDAVKLLVPADADLSLSNNTTLAPTTLEGIVEDKWSLETTVTVTTAPETTVPETTVTVTTAPETTAPETTTSETTTATETTVPEPFIPVTTSETTVSVTTVTEATVTETTVTETTSPETTAPETTTPETTTVTETTVPEPFIPEQPETPDNPVTGQNWGPTAIAVGIIAGVLMTLYFLLFSNKEEKYKKL